jgi:hypothetical protein
MIKPGVPRLEGNDLNLVIGEAVCNRLGWTRPAKMSAGVEDPRCSRM